MNTGNTNENISKSRLQSVYISPSLEQCLDDVKLHRITCFIAPAGYGKSTAVNYFKHNLSSFAPKAVLYKQDILSKHKDDFWRGFCRLIKKVFPTLAVEMQGLGYPNDAQSLSVLMELWEDVTENTKAHKKDIYLVLNDIHFLEDISNILLHMVKYLPQNMYFIVTSRNDIFNPEQKVQLGSQLFVIGVDELRLNSKDIQAYATLCGINMAEHEANELFRTSEGWIALIYLAFRNFVESNSWDFDVDIFTLMEHIMLNNLHERHRKFLIINSVHDMFDADQAAYIWQEDDAKEILNFLSNNNAFISREKKGIFRYHHMLKELTLSKFNEYNKDEQTSIYERYADLQTIQGNHLTACLYYEKNNNWERLLQVLMDEKAEFLAAKHKKIIRRWTHNCPVDLLITYPQATLLLMMECFVAQDIEQLLKFNDIIMKSLEQNTKLSVEEKNNIIGECQILLSFLNFNDVAGMSEYHKRACELMTRPTQCFAVHAPWTFGSPSIIMLFHRKSGILDEVNDEMARCIPYYYKVTDGHGHGCEYALRAETHFMRAQLEDAETQLQLAIHAAKQKNQMSIRVVAEFTAMRIHVFKGEYDTVPKRLHALRQASKEKQKLFMLPAIDLCEGWLYALLGKPEYIPSWILEDGAENSMSAQCIPFLYLVRNQVAVLNKDWEQIIIYAEEQKAFFAMMHMELALLYLYAQLAICYDRIGQRERALLELKLGLDLALPDNLRMPFVLSAELICPLLEKLKDSGSNVTQINEILDLIHRWDVAKHKVGKEHFGESPRHGFTKQEQNIAKFAAQRKTYSEIAALLFISENTVKTHMKQIYKKLNLSGSERNKRNLLEKIITMH